MQNNEYKTLDDFLGKDVKSGMVALVGPPNAGKSTLMNHMLGQKISIVTNKPQTTRNKILGIVNDDDSQIVLLDTPGLHKPDEPLNIEMMRVAMESLEDVDAVLFIVDISLPLPDKVRKKQKEELAGYMEKIKSPAILVLNKVDLMDKDMLLPIMQGYADLFPFKAVVPISALKGQGVTALHQEILDLMPVGPRLFPQDIPTDSTERFLAAEIVREKVFLQMGQEIPYSTATIVEDFKEDEARNMITIHVSIVVTRPSQKGMLIGKGGSKLKSIGTSARIDIEKLLGAKVVLKLWVKVKKKWDEDENFLKELGF